ncbi:MAG: RelA/SpoT family protein [Bacteroidia bacterium]|jgi:GTP pyrophosphokinase|nr:RelA/SpoT family protein [Bacteroidia bacterium]GIV24112.1 MAG: RelA/SpoT family protein [Bacteroidia bacterium]
MQQTWEVTFSESEKKAILNAYRRLLRACADFLDKKGRAEVRKAFRFALEQHGATRRRTGEPYILHPIAVALILVREIGLRDKYAVMAALLHDVVEDTDTEIETLRWEFGDTVGHLVEALTKITRVQSPLDSVQAETFRKILLTMADDIRVALIKLADRLHNLRTLTGMKPEKQAKILAETEFIYVPIAHRLGLYPIKSEMEDLILRYREPEVYAELERKLQETARERERYIQRFIQPIEEKLKKEIGVPYKIESRVKSISSIYHKMRRQGVPFEEVYDIFAVRIILDSPIETEKADCWRTYSIVTSLYRPNLSRLRDWISQPRPTGYEALHITVMGPEGKWVEVQIRSRRMHEAAEYGLVAHWRYKSTQNGHPSAYDEALERWLNRIRSLLENPDLSSIDLLHELHPDIAHDEVYVFTPKGELKVLPAGATALDFAYEIHSEIGRHAIAAKVNGRPVLLNYVLQNADQVEIITSERAEPTEEQLSFVKTGRARLKIREYLKQQRKQAMEKGRQIFEWRLRHLGIRPEDPVIRELLWYLRLPSLEELWYRLGTHTLDLGQIQDFIRLKRLSQGTTPLIDQLSQQLGLLSGALEVGYPEEKHTYAPCCYPIPFDSIMGYMTAEGLVIHRTTCREIQRLLSLDSAKVKPLRWAPTPQKPFLAALLLEGEDRQGMLLDIVKVISLKKNKNIRSIRIEGQASYFKGIIELYVYNEPELLSLIKALGEVRGLLKIERYQAQLNA